MPVAFQVIRLMSTAIVRYGDLPINLHSWPGREAARMDCSRRYRTYQIPVSGYVRYLQCHWKACDSPYFYHSYQAKAYT